MRSRPCQTVMLVNDDQSFVDISGDALRIEGLAVLLVPGLRQASTALETGFTPDVVMLDVDPKAELRDFLHCLWTERGLRGVPVVAVSRGGDGMVQVTDDGRLWPLAAPSDARELSLVLDALCTDGPQRRERPGGDADAALVGLA